MRLITDSPRAKNFKVLSKPNGNSNRGTVKKDGKTLPYKSGESALFRLLLPKLSNLKRQPTGILHFFPSSLDSYGSSVANPSGEEN